MYCSPPTFQTIWMQHLNYHFLLRPSIFHSWYCSMTCYLNRVTIIWAIHGDSIWKIVVKSTCFLAYHFFSFEFNLPFWWSINIFELSVIIMVILMWFDMFGKNTRYFLNFSRTTVMLVHAWMFLNFNSGTLNRFKANRWNHKTWYTYKYFTNL